MIVHVVEHCTLNLPGCSTDFLNYLELFANPTGEEPLIR